MCYRLEPLLHRIKEERTAVLVPIIDVIDDKTLEYMHNEGSLLFQIGGFSWSGHFTWHDIPIKEIKRRGSVIAPTWYVIDKFTLSNAKTEYMIYTKYPLP